jgi:hypothetical protein
MPTYDEQLLLDFANQFLGYGSLNSALWLIGPEAGGEQSIEDVSRRALVWSNRGRKETEDLHDYHADLGLPARFDWTRNIQPCWGPLIRVVLAIDGIRADKEDVREFQKRELGRAGGQNSVLDLSQLSSPSMSDWKLHECGISWLATREEYESCLLLPRCDLLRERLVHYKPRLVLFYGLSHQRWWERISASHFAPSKVPQLSWVRSENSLFAMMPHPNVRLSGKGVRNKFFADIGAALREKLR